MHCTLLITDLMLPRAFGAEPYRELLCRALQKIWTRGTTTLQPALESYEWLCRAFGIEKSLDWPLAPLMAQADGIDASNGYWLAATPAHLQIERNEPVLSGQALDDLSLAEAASLGAALNEHFSGEHMRLIVPYPNRWYLCVERVPKFTTTALAAAVNQGLSHSLLKGDDARDWQRLFNEAQMVLHAHPINIEREARGRPSANCIWLWGGGTLPKVSAPSFDDIWSDDFVAAALSRAAGITHHALPDGADHWLRSAADDGDHLLSFEQLTLALRRRDPEAWKTELVLLERKWLSPLLHQMRSGGIESLRLIANDRERLRETTLTVRDARKWWRRTLPLEQFLKS